MLLLLLRENLKVVGGEALSDLWCDGGVTLDLDECLEFQDICRAQVGSIALNESKQRLVPHDWHLLLIVIVELIQVFIIVFHSLNKALVSIDEVDEEVDERIDDLSGQGVFLG